MDNSTSPRSRASVGRRIAVTVGLGYSDAPADGYKLAADFCQHYDSRYGNSLNGPSRAKITEIAHFLSTYEAFEEDEGR